MRFKEIPSEVIAPIKRNPGLVLGGVVLALGAWYILGQGPAAGSDPVPAPGDASAMGSGAPIVYSQAMPAIIGGDAGSGLGSAGANSPATLDPTVAAALAITGQKNQNDFFLAMATLQAQSDVLATQANLAMAQNLTTRLGYVSGIAQTFLSNQDWGNGHWSAGTFSGSIVDSMGQSLLLNFNTSHIDPGKGKSSTAAVGVINSLFAANNTNAPKANIATVNNAPAPTNSTVPPMISAMPNAALPVVDNSTNRASMLSLS